MNNVKVMSLKLLAIAGVAALVLGVVNAFTSPRIAEIERDAKIEALGNLIQEGTADPDSEVFLEDHDVIKSYFTIENSGKVTGYILSLNAKGYGGAMGVMASYTKDGDIINSILMANQETPGFGKKAEKQEYMDVFKGKGRDGNPIPEYTYQVDNTDVVSSATITFMGLSKALVSGSDFVKGGL